MKKPIWEEKRREISEGYLGKTVQIKTDRPKGFVHHKNGHEIVYPINYGYVPGVLGGDGEELDVYLLDVPEPVSEYTVKIIAVVERSDDVEDKLVGIPVGGKMHTKEEIAQAVNFQEKYHTLEIVLL